MTNKTTTQLFTNDEQKILTQIINNEMYKVFSYDYLVSHIEFTKKYSDNFEVSLCLYHYGVNSITLEQLKNMNYKLDRIQSCNRLDRKNRLDSNYDKTDRHNYLILNLEVDLVDKLTFNSEYQEELLETFEYNNSKLDEIKESIKSFIKDELVNSKSRLVNNYEITVVENMNQIYFEYNYRDSGTFIFSDSNIYDITSHIKNTFDSISINSVDITDNSIVYTLR